MTFDLEKARASDEALPYPLDAKEIWISGKGQMHINPPNEPSIFFTLSDLCEFRNLFHGQAAEIERLRAEMENYGDDYVCQMNDLRSRAQTAEARIQELEAALVEADQCRRSLLDQVMKVANQRDKAEVRIQELEDAHKRSGAKYAKIINELRSSVYANTPGLKKQWDEILNTSANGKIGPDATQHDHTAEFFRPNESPAKSWKITDGRVRAIQWAEEMAGDCKAGDVLRAMLETGQ